MGQTCFYINLYYSKHHSIFICSSLPHTLPQSAPTPGGYSWSWRVSIQTGAESSRAGTHPFIGKDDERGGKAQRRKQHCEKKQSSPSNEEASTSHDEAIWLLASASGEGSSRAALMRGMFCLWGRQELWLYPERRVWHAFRLRRAA